MNIQKTIRTIHDQENIAIDMFGRKLKVGDTVLCKGYYSLDKNTFATIKKINKRTIVVDIERYCTDLGEFKPKPANYAGYWNCYPDRKRVRVEEPMKRYCYETMLISPELKQEILDNEQYLLDTYPEHFI